MLSEFAGNKKLISRICENVRNGRFPHAIIIEGDDGLGKHTLARIIAAAAVCEDSRNAPCGKCRACTLAKKGSHTDIYTYSPEGMTFKIKTARQIRDSAIVVPIEAERKVIIMEHCELMNESTQNCLLKILEEPPAFTVFILLCTSAMSLLVTVRSRCTLFSINPPEKAEAIAYIARRISADEEQISAALDSCGCNIGRTLSMLTDSSAAEKQKAAADFFTAIIQRKRLDAMICLTKYGKNSKDAFEILSELKLLFAEEIRAKVAGKHSVLPYDKIIKIENIINEISEYLALYGNSELAVTSLTSEIFAVL